MVGVASFLGSGRTKCCRHAVSIPSDVTKRGKCVGIPSGKLYNIAMENQAFVDNFPAKKRMDFPYLCEMVIKYVVFDVDLGDHFLILGSLLKLRQYLVVHPN